MTWTLTSLVVQIVAGVVGGHLAATAAHETDSARSVTHSPASPAGF